jgi:uncharacterized protein YjbI with pentapeptide repeats
MNPITKWELLHPSLGWSVQPYAHEWCYAGGFVTVGLGAGYTPFNVYSLGEGKIALEVAMHNPDKNLYLNSHTGDAMMIWHDYDNYTSDQIGPEQSFKLVNLGEGKIALQATAGNWAGQYLSGVSGGWYPEQFDYGFGHLQGGSGPIGAAQTFAVTGDQLPILLITNDGHYLHLEDRDLGALNLNGANMQGAFLNGANLSAVTSWTGANFTGAHLQRANLNGHSLAGAIFDGADFTGTDLRQCTASQNAKMTKAILHDAKLTKLDLTGAHVQGAQFTGKADLGEVIFAGADLTGADFTDANLTGADFRGAILTGATFTRAAVTKADFRGAHLQGAKFIHVDLSVATFDPVPDFTRTTTNRTIFDGSIVPYAALGLNWSYLDLRRASLVGLPTNLDGLDATQALLPDDLNLAKSSLKRAQFTGCQMYGINLTKADLDHATLTGARLKQATLVDANLSKADLSNAYLIAEESVGSSSAKPSAAIASGAFMINTVLDGAYCDGVDFEGALFLSHLSYGGGGKATAVRATMNQTKFNNAVCVGALFDQAQLAGADFGSAVLVVASMQGAKLIPSTGNPETDASLYKADIRGLQAAGANMDRLDMRGATVSTEQGTFTNNYIDFYGNPVNVALRYGKTVLGNTTSGTVCPDGELGPCKQC